MRYISGGDFLSFCSIGGTLVELSVNYNEKTEKIGPIPAVSVRFRHFCGHFLDVEGYGEEGEVHRDLVFAEVPEASVLHAVFHLPEHGFGLYGPS